MGVLSWLSGYDADNAQAAAFADAKLRELNQARYGKDYFNTDEWVAPVEQEKQIGVAFDEGWAEGKRNVSGFVRDGFGLVGDVLTSVLKGIPWWIWAGVILYFAWPFIAQKLVRK